MTIHSPPINKILYTQIADSTAKYYRATVLRA